jgi:hypothetical protein
MNHLIHFRAINKVVIHGVSGKRADAQVQWEAIVHVGEGGSIPHQRVALAGQEQGNRDIGIVLAEFYGGSAVIEQATLMLSQAVEPLGKVSRKSIFDMESFLAIQLSGIICPRDGVSLA